MANNSDSWRGELSERVNLALSEIAFIKSQIQGHEVSQQIEREMCEPYLDILEEIYTREYPLAEAMDSSDLVVRLNGDAVDQESPRLSIISSYFTKIRTQVTSLAKVLAHMDSNVRRLPKQFDLTLTAYGRGSVIMGFALPSIQQLEDSPEGRLLFGENDLLYSAAREAMKTLGVVSQAVSQGGGAHELAAIVPDADVRDAAMVAIKNLAPSGRVGVKSVAIGGKSIGGLTSGMLTTDSRERMRRELKSPVLGDETSTISGQIREMDLDARRFELRHVFDSEANSVRCKYPWESDLEAKSWLNMHVRVTGKVERDKSGRPRLMDVEQIEKT
jgi:hypothetical protein